MRSFFHRTPPEVEAKALLAVGQGFDALGREQEAFEAYERLVRQYGNSRNEEARRMAANGLVCKASAFGSRGRFEQAIETADEYMRRYGHDQSLRSLTSVALMGKCIGLISLLRLKEAVTLCDDILREYDGDTDPVICQAVEKVRGYRMKAISDESEVSVQKAMTIFTNSLKGLQPEASDEEVLAACDEVVKCYSGAADPDMRLAAVYALMKKSSVLSHAGNTKEAMSGLTKLVMQFQDDIDPRVLGLVNSAREMLAGGSG